MDAHSTRTVPIAAQDHWISNAIGKSINNPLTLHAITVPLVHVYLWRFRRCIISVRRKPSLRGQYVEWRVGTFKSIKQPSFLRLACHGQAWVVHRVTGCVTWEPLPARLI